VDQEKYLSLAATNQAHPYYGPGNVVIDSCAECGYVRLDHAELSSVERSAGGREPANIVDLLLVAAIVERVRSVNRLNWQPLVFDDEQRLPLHEFGIPKATPSIVKVRMAGDRTILGLIAGSVTVTPQKILADAKTTVDGDGLALPVHTNHNSSWWWD